MRILILSAVRSNFILGTAGISLPKSTRHSAWLMMVVSLVIVHICGLCVAEQASDEGGVRPVGKVEEVKTGFTFTEGPALALPESVEGCENPGILLDAGSVFF